MKIFKKNILFKFLVELLADPLVHLGEDLVEHEQNAKPQDVPFVGLVVALPVNLAAENAPDLGSV